MDKKEYNEKLEEIKGLIAAEDYSSAAQIADSIDWKRVRNVQTLVMISEVYEAVERYEDSKTLLLRAYRRSPVGRTVLYRLVEVTIKLNQFDEAIEYYSEYVQAAPRDNSRYILKYKIYRARGSSVDEQISILKEYLKQEYNEKWAYELAKLQISAGRTQDALSTCDDLVLWFHSGKYVIKALELKRRYAPLTPKQQEIYDSRFDDEDAAEIAEEGDDTSYLKQAEAFKRADRADQQQEKIKSELARDISRVTRNRELMENNAAAQNLQPDKTPEESAAPEAAPAGKSLTGAASAEQAITEPAFTEAASAEQAIAETVFTETAPAEQAITETAFTEAAPAEQAIAETAFAGAVSSGTEDTGETFTGAALNEAVQEAGEKAEEGPGEAASAGSEDAESALGEAVPGAAGNEESVPAEAAAEAAGAAESDAAGFVQDTVYAENAEPEAGEPSLTDADLYAEEAEPETAPDPYAGIRSDYDPQQMQEDLIQSMREIVSGVGARQEEDSEETRLDEMIEQSKEDQENAVAARGADMTFRVPVSRASAERAEASKLTIDDILLAMGEKGDHVRKITSQGSVLPADEEAQMNAQASAFAGSQYGMRSGNMDGMTDTGIAAGAADENVTGAVSTGEFVTDAAGAGENMTGGAGMEEAEAGEGAAISKAAAEEAAAEAAFGFGEEAEGEPAIGEAPEAGAAAGQGAFGIGAADAEKASDLEASTIAAGAEEDDAAGAAEAAIKEASVIAASVVSGAAAGEDAVKEAALAAAAETAGGAENKDGAQGASAGAGVLESLYGLPPVTKVAYTKEIAEAKTKQLPVDEIRRLHEAFLMDTPVNEARLQPTDPVGGPLPESGLTPDNGQEAGAAADLSQPAAQAGAGVQADLYRAAGTAQAADPGTAGAAEVQSDPAGAQMAGAPAEGQPAAEAAAAAAGQDAAAPFSGQPEGAVPGVGTVEVEADPSAAGPQIYGARPILKEYQKDLFRGFLGVGSLEEQIANAIMQAESKNGDRTSRTGNILILGGHGCGKTTIATGIAKAVAEDMGTHSVKMARIYAADLNRKDIAATIAKIAGGILIIEEAGDLEDAVVDQLTTAMEFRTDGLIVILEDEQRYIHDMLMRHPRFTMKFTAQIYIPVFTNDNLVDFGAIYADSQDYVLDERAEQVLYDRIDAVAQNGGAVSITNVVELVDRAIHNANKFFRKLGSQKKRYDSLDRIILREKDFR